MRRISYFAALAVAVAACNDEPQVTQPGESRGLLPANAEYQVEILPSLGGSLSRGMGITKQGLVAGWSDQSDGARRASLWRNGVISRLGTLGGPMSTVPWPGVNNDGMVVGISHTTLVDPLNEDWSCELGGFLPATTNLICRGFVYQDGVMRELPTLGGNHGFAAGINNEGQVVGWAETPVHDGTCTDAQVLQFRAVLWEPKKSRIDTRELRPWPGDSTSAATAINDRGQVVGISGDCDQAVGRFSALRGVLWEPDGSMIEIPNLGGVTWHTPMAINKRGDVVGFSNPPGAGDPEGDFIAHAFLWINGAAQAIDLGVLPGNLFSQAFAINNLGQVVGISFGGTGGTRAFLWQGGVMMNLNDLMGAGNLDVFLSAQDINDDGQITGRVVDHTTGQTRAFIATPVITP